MSRNKDGRAAGKNPTPEADDKGVKVKYISSPVMMEAKDASQFKEIVQHFTGRTPNETRFGMDYNPTTTKPVVTTTSTTTTTTTTTTGDQFFAYGASQTNPQVGIDSYSWEEIAEWNR